MITHYRTFNNIDNHNILNCEINAGEGVKAAGAFGNNAPLWVQLNKVYLRVVKLVDGIWTHYGVYSWDGAVAIKPNQLYDVVSDCATFPKGTYYLYSFVFETAPQTDGLYYQDGAFNLVFSR